MEMVDGNLTKYQQAAAVVRSGRVWNFNRHGIFGDRDNTRDSDSSVRDWVENSYILIADDEANAQNTRSGFMDDDHEVIEAKDAEEAVKSSIPHLSSDHRDLVLPWSGDAVCKPCRN